MPANVPASFRDEGDGTAVSNPSGLGNSGSNSSDTKSNGGHAYTRFYSPTKKCYFWKRPGDLNVIREGERHGAWEEYFEVGSVILPRQEKPYSS